MKEGAASAAPFPSEADIIVQEFLADVPFEQIARHRGLRPATVAGILVGRGVATITRK